jgi:hypothetical protein
VKVTPKPGILSYPTTFRFAVAPRSEGAVRLLEEVRARNPEKPSNPKDVQAIVSAGEVFA